MEYIFISLNNKNFIRKVCKRKGFFEIYIPTYLFKDKIKIGNTYTIKIDPTSDKDTPHINKAGFIDLVRYIPNKWNGRNIIKYIRNNKIYIHIYSSLSIELPRFLPYTIETFTFFGLIQGDGAKNRLAFGNTNKKLVKFFLDFLLNQLKISKEEIDLHLTHHYLLSEKESNKVKKEWENELNFNVTGVSVRGDINKFKSLGEISTPRICYAASILGSLENLKQGEITEPMFIGLMRGILASDGFPRIRKNKLNRVHIAISSKIEGKFYISLLSKYGIYSKIDTSLRTISISYWDSYLKLFMMNGFKLHEKRNDKFIDGFLNMEKTKQLIKISNLIYKPYFTTADLNLPFKCHSGKLYFLESLMRNNLIDKIARKKGGRTFHKYIFTLFGKKFVKLIVQQSSLKNQ